MMKKWYVSRNHFASLRKVEKFNDDEEARNRHLIYTHSVITNGLIVEPIFEYIVVPVPSSYSISSNVEYVHERKIRKTEDGEKDDNANKVKPVPQYHHNILFVIHVVIQNMYMNKGNERETMEERTTMPKKQKLAKELEGSKTMMV